MQEIFFDNRNDEKIFKKVIFLSNEEVISDLQDFVVNGENYTSKKFKSNQNIGVVSAMKFENVTRIFSYETEIAAANADFIILSGNENHTKSTKSLLNRLAETWKKFEFIDEKIYQNKVSKHFLGQDNF